MGQDGDDRLSLPNPPPPRPAARREAIDAALRKFDGMEDAPAAGRRKRPLLVQWASTHRAAAGGLVTAALFAVIAIPAIQVAIRDNPQQVASEDSLSERAPAYPDRQAQLGGIILDVFANSSDQLLHRKLRLQGEPCLVLCFLFGLFYLCAILSHYWFSWLFVIYYNRSSCLMNGRRTTSNFNYRRDIPKMRFWLG